MVRWFRKDGRRRDFEMAEGSKLSDSSAMMEGIEKALRQFFFDGRLSTSMFNMHDDVGRKEAAKYFANEMRKVRP